MITWLLQPKTFNVVIMALYLINAAWWAYHKRWADVCYWLSAFAKFSKFVSNPRASLTAAVRRSGGWFFLFGFFLGSLWQLLPFPHRGF